MAFSSVPRFISPKKVSDSKELRQAAAAIKSDWSPYLWTRDQLCRVLFLSITLPSDPAAASEFLVDLYDTADMSEQVAIFSALPILPHPASNIKLAADGLRTNMAPVFDSIALHNPYPTDHFAEAPWNQMFLKAAFMERPLYKINGVEQRANVELSRIILDYVHERWAAGRIVSPEIWRPTAQFLSSEHREALEKLAQDSDELQRAAAALTLNPASAASDQTWDWNTIGQKWNQGIKN